MLRDDIALYTELSGHDGEHTAIGIIGAYLDGYDKGKEDRPQGEWIMNKTSARGRNYTCTNCQKVSRNKSEFCPKCGADMRGVR